MFSVKEPQPNWSYINKSKKYVYEFGLSDHHKLIWTIWKSESFKRTRRIQFDRSYKSFKIDNFNSILNQKLNNLSSTTYGDFEETFLSFLNKRAPLQKENITTQ